MDSGDQSVTIEEVAKAAGVSVSTVSRTINDKPDVAQSTKQRIRKTMDELGYTPHRYASNLAGGLSRTVALLLPISEGGIRQLILDFIVGASKALEERDFFLNVVTKEMDESELRSLRRKSQIDGVILMRTRLVDPRVDALRETGLPFVMLGRCADNAGLSFVDLDFRTAMDKTLRYLKQFGHEHVGFIAYDTKLQNRDYTYIHLTIEAFHELSRELGLSTVVVPTESHAEAVADATRSLMARDPEITAILTVYGELVTVIEKTLKDSDLDVPEDISLVAMTEDKTAERMAPALTSVTFPSEEMGFRAAELLVDRILLRTAPYEPKQFLLEPTLTPRETTALRRKTESAG